MVRTQIQFTEDQLNDLRRRAARLGVSVSEVVRRAVALLSNADAAQDEASKRERALAVAGRFASGRSDVARDHDRHLADAYR